MGAILSTVILTIAVLGAAAIDFYITNLAEKKNTDEIKKVSIGTGIALILVAALALFLAIFLL